MKKKKKKPVRPVKVRKVIKSTCCKTCGRKPRRKQIKFSQEEIDSRNIAMAVFGSLLLVTAFTMQSKYWIYALPLLLLCCSLKTVKLVVFASFFVRTNIGTITDLFKEALKWLLPIGSSLSVATFLTPIGEGMLCLGIFAFTYAAQLLATIISDLNRYPTTR